MKEKTLIPELSSRDYLHHNDGVDFDLALAHMRAGLPFSITR